MSIAFRNVVGLVIKKNLSQVSLKEANAALQMKLTLLKRLWNTRELEKVTPDGQKPKGYIDHTLSLF